MTSRKLVLFKEREREGERENREYYSNSLEKRGILSFEIH